LGLGCRHCAAVLFLSHTPQPTAHPCRCWWPTIITVFSPFHAAPQEIPAICQAADKGCFFVRPASAPTINHPDTQHSTLNTQHSVPLTVSLRETVEVSQYLSSERRTTANPQPVCCLSCSLSSIPTAPFSASCRPSLGNPACCRLTKILANATQEPRTHSCRFSDMRLTTQLQEGKLQTDEIPRTTVMSLCSLTVKTAGALGTQMAGWLCSVEQTDSVMVC
jgi:hypothetical protein